MKLFTWQNPEFDITDSSIKVESREYSQYDYLDAYQKLWDKYGTDQILWCYSSFSDATSCGALAYKGMALWELEVPEHSFLDVTCPYAWNWVISDSDCTPPKHFEKYYSVIKSLLTKSGLSHHHDDFSRDYNQYWKTLMQEDLFGVLSVDLNKCKRECPIIILAHPVKKDCVLVKQLYDNLNIKKF